MSSNVLTSKDMDMGMGTTNVTIPEPTNIYVEQEFPEAYGVQPNENYNLLYISDKGVLKLVDKKTWLTDNEFMLSEHTTNISTLINPSKITQLNSGKFLYISSTCNLCICDSNFTGSIQLSDLKFTSVAQLSNYVIYLTSNDGNIYLIRSLKDTKNITVINDGSIYISIKQTGQGKILMVEGKSVGSTTVTTTTDAADITSTTVTSDTPGIPCGYTYSFDLDKYYLVNKKELALDRAVKNRVSVLLPNQTQIFNLDCDPKLMDKIYKYALTTNIKTNRETKCSGEKDFDAGYCYDRCKEDYKGSATRCYKNCNKGDITTGVSYCMESCRSGYKNKAGVCWKNKPLTKTRGAGIPAKIKTTCKKWKCKTKNYCNSNRELYGSLCYKTLSGIDKNDYKCVGPVCHLIKPSYAPKTYKRDSYDRGAGKPAGNSGLIDSAIESDYKQAKAITCGLNCCSVDLTFYNPNFVKPTDLVLPNIPVISGLDAFYDYSSFRNGIWYDLSANSDNVIIIDGIINFNSIDKYLYGDTNTSILFPVDLVLGNYTIFNVSKYNGTNQGKILTGWNNNWFSGFNSGISGVSGRDDNYITQSELSLFDNNWVFSTDTNQMYRANGNNYTTVQIDSSVNTNAHLSINKNRNKSDNSDWAIACIIIYNRILTDSEIVSVENWITQTYSNLWNTTYNETYAQAGYKCYDNKIGKIIDDYSNYQYVLYNGKPASCNYLDYPYKYRINSYNCKTSTRPNILSEQQSIPSENISSEQQNVSSEQHNVYSENKETFGNIQEYPILEINFIFKLIILIILLFIVKYTIYKTNKKL